jgi:hypothetical protein
MYDPRIGRWTGEDPVGFRAGDPNLLRYVGNDPTNATDPSGLTLKRVFSRPSGAKEVKDNYETARITIRLNVIPPPDKEKEWKISVEYGLVVKGERPAQYYRGAVSYEARYEKKAQPVVPIKGGKDDQDFPLAGGDVKDPKDVDFKEVDAARLKAPLELGTIPFGGDGTPHRYEVWIVKQEYTGDLSPGRPIVEVQQKMILTVQVDKAKKEGERGTLAVESIVLQNLYSGTGRGEETIHPFRTLDVEDPYPPMPEKKP